MKKNLQFDLIFNVPCKVIYNALIDPMEIMKYTRAPCQIEPKENGTFSLFEGKIVGKFLQLKPSESIKMEWKFDDWEAVSLVEISFQERDDDVCKVEINQSGIPSKIEIAKLEEGWKNMIFLPMSKICGYPIEDE